MVGSSSSGNNTSRCALHIAWYFWYEFTGAHWADNPEYDGSFAKTRPMVFSPVTRERE